ncbi:MAG TPA: hypothetical protein PKX17_02805 [Candidatus Methanomethylicus sp.]|nr:hypothetical protein [Candidatus Methanomethylicus sp.]
MILSIYGFEIDVPKEYFILITKDSLYYRGSIDISDHFKHTLKILWDDLDEFKANYATPKDFFEEKINAIKRDKDLVSVDSETYTWANAGEHPFHFHKIWYATKRRFTKELNTAILGLVVQCLETSRYYLLFYEFQEGKNEFEEKAKTMMGSFKCNCSASE